MRLPPIVRPGVPLSGLISHGSLRPILTFVEFADLPSSENFISEFADGAAAHDQLERRLVRGSVRERLPGRGTRETAD